MKIRKASTEDAPNLTSIALGAKRYWGYPDHWIKHWQDQLTISTDFITANPVFVAENESQILGFYALVIENNKAELEHLWVDPAHIGTGVGTKLFLHAMQNAASENVDAVEITADPNAEEFYKKMGAYRTGEMTSEIEGQPRVLPQLKIEPIRKQ